MNILGLLDLVEGLTVTKTHEGFEITYYVTGIYNSGTDWGEIDIENLSRLKRVCETIIKLERSLTK